MTLPLYYEDLCEIFQRSGEPNIFPHNQKGDVCLEDFPAKSNNADQSVKAIHGIMNAIVALRLNLIMPCQIKFTYVIRKKGEWGLRHVICDRSSEQVTGDDVYNPEQSNYHEGPENELMWNIGKIWLRFFTETPVRIKYDKQEKINKIIDEAVPFPKIKALIKRLLTWDRRLRMTFEEFLEDEFFIEQLNQSQSSFFSSVIGHLKCMSNIVLLESRPKLNELSENFYTRQIRYRCFLEYLQVDLIFQNLRSDLRKQYYGGSDVQKSICELSNYIISVQNYFNMMKLNNERLQIGERLQELQQRLYYARFSKRMVLLRENIDKTARKLQKNKFLDPSYKIFFKPIEELDRQKVYLQFKNLTIEYADYLNQDLKKQDNDRLSTLRLLAKIYVVRTSSYIFSEKRSEVFEPLLPADKMFNIKKLLPRINDCQNTDLLKQLLINIKKFYFS